MKSHFRIRTLWSVWLPGVLGVVVASLSAAEVPPPSQSSAPRTNATALVIIDVQNFYFPGGSLPLAEPAAASAQATKLLERFRALGWPVVHVQHLPQNQSAPAPDSGDPQYRIHSSVLPATGEKVIGKHHANAFRDTGLLAALREMGAGRLVIAGMQTHMCVEAVTRAAADLGFDVVVAHDACATRSLKFKGAEIPATQVHAATLAALQGNYARVISTDELLVELK